MILKKKSRSLLNGYISVTACHRDSIMNRAATRMSGIIIYMYSQDTKTTIYTKRIKNFFLPKNAISMPKDYDSTLKIKVLNNKY